jgi:hypothetical protein
MLEVRVHTKADVQTGYGRIDKQSSAPWNVQQPYLRCSCNQHTTVGCKGSVFWLDHAIWYILNRLELFFGKDILFSN